MFARDVDLILAIAFSTAVPSGTAIARTFAAFAKAYKAVALVQHQSVRMRTRIEIFFRRRRQKRVRWVPSQLGNILRTKTSDDLGKGERNRGCEPPLIYNNSDKKMMKTFKQFQFHVRVAENKGRKGGEGEPGQGDDQSAEVRTLPDGSSLKRTISSSRRQQIKSRNCTI